MTYFPFIEIRQDAAAVFIMERKYWLSTSTDKESRLSFSDLRDDEDAINKAYWKWGSWKSISIEEVE